MINQTLTAIIPAAGCGARTGLSGNKILAELAGRPVLSWTLHALAQAKVLLAEHDFNLFECVISARSEEFPLIEKINASNELPFGIRLVKGGDTRQQSVHHAVQKATGEWIMVHDAARPLASPALFAAVCQTARKSGGAIAALQASDTIKYAGEASGPAIIKSTFDRHRIWLAQTPQVFPRAAFLEALESAAQENFEGTDCSSLMERQGNEVVLVPGEIGNFKVTYLEDLRRAEDMLRDKKDCF